MRAANFARSGWGNILFQAVFLGGFYLIGSDAAPAAEGAWRALLLLGLVLVPSIVWPTFFYLRDRNEPEPSSHVLGALLAGMGVAAVVVLPVEGAIFRLNQWMYESTAALLLGSLLVRGALVSFMFFVVIRYAFLPSDEFDEPEDGMVYGAFLGAGFAGVKSVTYLAAHEAFTLFAIAHIASTNILLYASVGSLLGYLVGRSKFTRGNPQLTSVAALFVGMLLIGGYHAAHEMVFVSGSESAFAVSAVLTLGFAAVLLVGASMLMHRLDRAGPPQVLHRRPRPDLAIAFAALLVLVLGGFAKQTVTRDRAFSNELYGFSFRYPALELNAGLSAIAPLEGRRTSSTVFAAEGRNGGAFRFTVKAESAVANLASVDPLRYIEHEPLWLSLTEVSVADKVGVRARYAYIDNDDARHGDFPDVVWGYVDIVPNANATMLFSFEAPPESFRAHVDLYERVLSTVTWTN